MSDPTCKKWRKEKTWEEGKNKICSNGLETKLSRICLRSFEILATHLKVGEYTLHSIVMNRCIHHSEAIKDEETRYPTHLVLPVLGHVYRLQVSSFRKDLIRRSWALRVLSSTRTRSCSQGGFPTSVTCSVDSPICVALKVPSMKPEQAVGQHLAQTRYWLLCECAICSQTDGDSLWFESFDQVLSSDLMQDRPHSFPKDSSGA